MPDRGQYAFLDIAYHTGPGIQATMRNKEMIDRPKRRVNLLPQFHYNIQCEPQTRRKKGLVPHCLAFLRKILYHKSVLWKQ